VAVFPSTSERVEIPRRRIVVEIVDVDSPEFHKIQQSNKGKRPVRTVFLRQSKLVILEEWEVREARKF
jgi:hypothetical protein